MRYFKPLKNKSYNYKPRFYKGEGSPYEVKRKFSEFRVNDHKSIGVKQRFVNALTDYKTNPDKKANKRVLLIVAILVLIFMYIIDFDLSIFVKQR
ncbi:riboflavin synthase subunit beta [Paucihalobacter ruber]|uniref:Riboflavin synthase subunit beta n=1 Tax=Paucihalobacter ruber TaxID=2567861 RepID=A0A506PJJ8_9FLAO|nr:riboflavin synthase subunit beta [Paucihalobacter ruber]TPV33983.1 riboflavin synthase subunit beta [Paucihalobacter ruber]